jgi:predicted DNA-binding transcriptional regulator AlpA
MTERAVVETEERAHGRSAVAEMFDCSPSSVDRLEAAGIIPTRRQLGRGRVGWLHSELVAALRALPKGPARGRTEAARAPEAQAKAAESRRRNRAARPDA